MTPDEIDSLRTNRFVAVRELVAHIDQLTARLRVAENRQPAAAVTELAYAAEAFEWVCERGNIGPLNDADTNADFVNAVAVFREWAGITHPTDDETMRDERAGR